MLFMVCRISSGTNKWRPIFYDGKVLISNNEKNAASKYVSIVNCMRYSSVFILNGLILIMRLTALLFISALGLWWVCQSDVPATELDYLWLSFDQQKHIKPNKKNVLNWTQTSEGDRRNDRPAFHRIKQFENVSILSILSEWSQLMRN